MASYHFETDLDRIKELGHLREEENQRFRHFLKNRNVQKTDQLVNRLHSDVALQIDCTTCGNCCSQLSPYLSNDDVKKLAEGTRLTVEEVTGLYLETDEQGVSFRELPCHFLADNKCTIYQHRPETCASFPHLHKPDFKSRSRRTFEYYAICPIIFNVIERLKQATNFE